MKKIVLYTRRNVGLYALSYLKAKGFEVKIVTDDHWVRDLADYYWVEEVTMETMGDFDLLLSVHWHKIIPKEYLSKGVCVNIHPCIKYKGKDPIRRYIENKDMTGTIDSHYMIEKPDEGELICSLSFMTGEVKNYADFYNQVVPMYFSIFELTLEKLNIKP